MNDDLNKSSPLYDILDSMTPRMREKEFDATETREHQQISDGDWLPFHDEIDQDDYDLYDADDDCYDDGEGYSVEGVHSFPKLNADEVDSLNRYHYDDSDHMVIQRTSERAALLSRGTDVNSLGYMRKYYENHVDRTDSESPSCSKLRLNDDVTSNKIVDYTQGNPDNDSDSKQNETDDGLEILNQFFSKE